MSVVRNLVIFLLLTACSGESKQPLTIHTDKGDVAFMVEAAITPQEQAKGLMYRDKVDPNTGMIFDFATADQPERQIQMWMKNTMVPLDMIFINQQGVIIKIAAMTTPYSLKVIPSDLPVRAALEIAGGESERLGIKAGQRISHQIFLK